MNKFRIQTLALQPLALDYLWEFPIYIRRTQF